jgi:hypothetical protein
VDPLHAFRTVDDAAAVAVGMVAAESRLQDVWRHTVVQLLDDYTSVRRHEGVEAAQAMWSDRPRPAGDRRVDAAFAALGEYLARRDNWRARLWVRDPTLEAVPWWFVTALKGMHPRALVTVDQCLDLVQSVYRDRPVDAKVGPHQDQARPPGASDGHSLHEEEAVRRSRPRLSRGNACGSSYRFAAAPAPTPQSTPRRRVRRQVRSSWRTRYNEDQFVNAQHHVDVARAA